MTDGQRVGGKDTSNLHAALQRLRLSDRRLLIWADAVCIDQSNVDERGKQVRLMQDIYSRAYETVVFLGEAGEEATLAIELGQKILDLAGRLPSGTIISIDNYESYYLPPSQSREWITLGMLYSVPWFRRVWIIQEFALSRNLLINSALMVDTKSSSISNH
jgi:Heterokaryon incompatibility protein (HET)